MTQQGGSLRFPGYYPAMRKPCRENCIRLFTCVAEYGEQRSRMDSVAGKRSLSACANELEAYKRCMDPIIAKEKEEDEKANQIWAAKLRESQNKDAARRNQTQQ